MSNENMATKTKRNPSGLADKYAVYQFWNSIRKRKPPRKKLDKEAIYALLDMLVASFKEEEKKKGKD